MNKKIIKMMSEKSQNGEYGEAPQAVATDQAIDNSKGGN